MPIPFITDNPVALSHALQRIARREWLARRRLVRSSFFQALCNRTAKHAQREHTVRISDTEVISSNIAY